MGIVRISSNIGCLRVVIELRRGFSMWGIHVWRGRRPAALTARAKIFQQGRQNRQPLSPAPNRRNRKEPFLATQRAVSPTPEGHLEIPTQLPRRIPLSDRPPPAAMSTAVAATAAPAKPQGMRVNGTQHPQPPDTRRERGTDEWTRMIRQAVARAEAGVQAHVGADVLREAVEAEG